MNREQFDRSLDAAAPPPGASPILKALWLDHRDDWHGAHDQVDSARDRDSAWVHAYLHRKEGDLANADYWYRRADRSRPDIPLDAEWDALVAHFCDG